MPNFTPVSALVGGLLTGASAALLLLLNGRIPALQKAMSANRLAQNEVLTAALCRDQESFMQNTRDECRRIPASALMSRCATTRTIWTKSRNGSTR